MSPGQLFVGAAVVFALVFGPSADSQTLTHPVTPTLTDVQALDETDTTDGMIAGGKQLFEVIVKHLQGTIGWYDGTTGTLELDDFGVASGEFLTAWSAASTVSNSPCLTGTSCSGFATFSGDPTTGKAFAFVTDSSVPGDVGFYYRDRVAGAWSDWTTYSGDTWFSTTVPGAGTYRIAAGHRFIIADGTPLELTTLVGAARQAIRLVPETDWTNVPTVIAEAPWTINGQPASGNQEVVYLPDTNTQTWTAYYVKPTEFIRTFDSIGDVDAETFVDGEIIVTIDGGLQPGGAATMWVFSEAADSGDYSVSDAVTGYFNAADGRDLLVFTASEDFGGPVETINFNFDNQLPVGPNPNHPNPTYGTYLVRRHPSSTAAQTTDAGFTIPADDFDWHMFIRLGENSVVYGGELFSVAPTLITPANNAVLSTTATNICTDGFTFTTDQPVGEERATQILIPPGATCRIDLVDYTNSGAEVELLSWLWNGSVTPIGGGTKGGLPQQGELPAAILTQGIYSANGTNTATTLPAATGSQDRVMIHATTTHGGTVIGVQPGESLLRVGDSSYTTQAPGELLLFIDSEVGNWDMNIVGNAISVSSRVGEMFFSAAGSTRLGVLPMTPGTVTGGALAYPVWAAMYPEFVSGDDIVFPANVAGMFVRNLGGGAANEGVFQADATAPNSLRLRTSSSAGGNTFNATTSQFTNTGFAGAQGTVILTGDSETRPNNRSYQLYTVTDAYDVRAMEGLSPQGHSIDAFETLALVPPPATYAVGAVISVYDDAANNGVYVCSGPAAGTCVSWVK